MTPLFYIIILSGLLLLLVYWILSSSEQPREKPRKAINRFHNEAAQELLKYLPSDDVKEEDEFSLYVSDNQIIVYWNITPQSWLEKLEKLEWQQDQLKTTIRLYDATCHLLDTDVEDINGTCHFARNPATPYYAMLGVSNNQHYIPFYLSNPVPADASGQ